MSEESTSGITRRDILKKSVIAGGLVWIAPTILASPAGATVGPCCPEPFGIRHDVAGACRSPLTSTTDPDNCLYQQHLNDDTPPRPITLFSGPFRPGCCLITAGLVTFTRSPDGMTHIYTFGPGVTLCGGAFVRCGTAGCRTQYDDDVIETLDGSGRVVRLDIRCLSGVLGHSEVLVCVEGSGVPGCP